MVMSIAVSQIEDQIRSGKLRISIVGLGQVGLLSALRFAEVGASVIGVDISEPKVELMKQGVCPLNIDFVTKVFNRLHNQGNLQFSSQVEEAAGSSHIHILCLPTPLDSNNVPDLSAVATACEAVGKRLRKGNLVILESTVYPGVTTKIVKPILEEASGLKAGEDFGLAYCFERIDPGNTEHRIDNTPKVVSGISEESVRAAAEVYGVIIEAPIIKVRNCETAEMVKLVENVFRDVNIAYANEIALLCQRLNIDVLEVLEAASTKWNFIPYIPGAGVGGTCIPVNPYYLLKCAKEAGLDLKLVPEARQINEGMAHQVVTMVERALDKIGCPLKKSKICILGVSYKADVDDIRGAPATKIATELEQLGAEIVGYDPIVTQAPQGINLARSLEEAVKDSDCLIFTNAHSFFQSLDLETIAALTHTPSAIVDASHVLVPKEVEASGITYFGLGRKQDSELNIWESGLKKR